MSLRDKIREILSENSVELRETSRSFHAPCPECGKSDKLYIDKKTGATVCFRDSWHFKGTFAHYLAKTLDITIEEAKDLIFSEGRIVDNAAPLVLDFLGQNQTEETEESVYLKEIHWPELGCSKATEWPEAISYLNGRGVTNAMIEKYDINYNPLTRRVLLPIKMSGKCYGWQGRAIDPVDAKNRIRNNVGFNRGKLVMFTDNIIKSDFCIVAEGPFDALKFEKVGGFVATMGNVITEEQFETIFSFGFKKLYIALDEDSPKEIRDLATKSPVETYILSVPESAKVRCKALGKKADFGECTLEECEKAFFDAKPFDSTTLLVYLKN